MVFFRVPRHLATLLGDFNDCLPDSFEMLAPGSEQVSIAFFFELAIGDYSDPSSSFPLPEIIFWLV